jgi:hypothetical protein
MAQELADKIRAAAQAKNIDPDIALAIARAESSLRPTAQAGTSSAGGLFQVVDKTWREFGGNPKKKLDADENIRVGTDIIAKNTQTLKSFLNRDPRPAEVYAAHYFGPSGAKNFLSADPATPIVDILGKKAVAANPNLKNKNVGQVMAQLEKKMGSAPAPAANVSRETPAPARQPLPPSLPPMAATEESSAPPSRMASLGPSYQAALALSFLADTDEKEDRDVEKEPGIAEKWLAQQAPRPAALAEFANVSIKSPFAAMEPQQPQMLADGGEVGEQSAPDVGRPTVSETQLAKVMFPDLPVAEAVYLIRGGQRQSTPQGEMLMGNLGAMVPMGKDSNAMLMLAGSRPEREMTESKALMAAFNKRVGDEGGLNLNVVRPLDAPGGVLAGGLSASYPLGEGRISGNVNALRLPGQDPRITGYGVGYGGRVGPGNLSAMIMKQKDGPYSGQVEYRLPIGRADGGEAAPTEEELAAASRPATVNPNIRRQGEAARRLAAMRDVNTLPDPRTYAAVSGFLGTPPDEQGFSVMNPDREGIKKAGQAGFGVGTALQVAPVVGKAAQMLGKMTGSALNERMLAGESLTPGFNTPAPINFAVKPRGGTFAYTPNDADRVKPITQLGKMIQKYGVAARDVDAPDEVLEFLRTKAPKYFTTSYGTTDDPLRTAFSQKRIQPFGTDILDIKPELIERASRAKDADSLQARIDLEKAYDYRTGINANMLTPEGSTWQFPANARKAMSEKMGQEGVTAEFRNPATLNAFSRNEFEEYPISTEMMRRFVENQDKLPPNLQRALQTGEPMYDAYPLSALLQPSNVVEALQQVPANKLKNMSFPEALIQGTQALAPVRDYLAAVALAEKGAKVPRKALDMFTTPVVEAPSFGGQWVTLNKSVAAKMEGKLMNHSVGDYNSGTTYGTAYTGLPYGGKKAFDEGLVRVYSLRDDQGLPKVTVEMAKSDGGKGNNWNVTQIRGRFNSEPLPETRNDIFSLLDKIDGQDGLNTIKQGSYSRLPTGESGPGTVVDWAKEYDLYKQSAE